MTRDAAAHVPTRPRVLHVAESFSAGVGAAIEQYVERMPEFDHILIYGERRESPVEASWLRRFVSAEPMHAGHLRRIVQIARLRARLRPEVVHLHSSFAGLYGRLAMSRRQVRVVFTPHCYAFERQDLRRPIRVAIRALESALSVNTTVVAACSPHEVELARQLRPGTDAVHVPSLTVPRDRTPPARPPVVVASGRLSAQKDPVHFLDIVKRFRDRHPLSEVRFEWIGNTDATHQVSFDEAGVAVTGWLSREEARERLARASVYVHTARWEGFPVSILDAVDAGVPLAVRDQPYARALPPDTLFPTIDAAVTLLEHGLRRSDDYRAETSWTDFLDLHSARRQRSALEAAYGSRGATR